MSSLRIQKLLAAAVAVVATSSAFSAQQAQSDPKAATTKPDNQPAPVIMLVPVEISDPAMKAGCWAQLFDERNFKGDMFTIVGPIQLDSPDKAGGRQLRRNIDSLMLGPKATLTIYEHKLFKDKSVQFGPNSKEGGLVKKLGFTGTIQSLKLDCGS